MKKILAILFSLALAFNLTITSFAAEAFQVSAEDTKLNGGSVVLVPVNISENNGIMGFRITVKYDPQKLDVRSVAKGTLTNTGNFSTDFGMKIGEFDIVWNNTSQIEGDGSLFVLAVSEGTLLEDNAKITLSFSQGDTFNEKYDDVKLACKEINLFSQNSKEEIGEPTRVVVENDSASESAPAENNTENVSLDDSQIISAVETALEQLGYKNIEDAKDDLEFLDAVNENLKILSGNDNNRVESYESVLNMYNSAYKNEFVNNTVNNVDKEVINEAISDGLDKVSSESISKIPKDKKEDFVKYVTDALKKADVDTPDLNNALSADAAMDTISSLAGMTEFGLYKQTDNTEKSPDNISEYFFIAVAVAVTIIVLISVVVIVLKLRKKKK